jgi:hypothetical protein
MKHLDNTARTPSTTAADRARTGPVLIDPRDFKLVAGGLPKGGWGAQADAARTTQLPKGGW